MTTQCPKCYTENPSDSKYCKECATPLPSAEGVQVSFTKTLLTPVEDLAQGSLFAGRYEIVEELGKGGMGKVYKALDNEIHEEVAIKLLRPEIASNEKVIERFRNELKIARKISHENVCRTYHFSKEEDTPYITMEYVPGEDLKNLIKKKGKLTKEEVLGIAKQVCEGLVAAHKLGVVHRDLKPQNIMIDEGGNAKIMDFGIARSVEAEGVTQTGVIIGTPDYISPEQAEGETADHRSDLYSLGVILYEMVTGTVPFKGDTALSVAIKHKTQLPYDPRKLNPDVSDELSRLILICMEKDKERRYQSAEALLNDLRNIEEGLPLGTKIQPRRATFIQTLIKKKLFVPSVVIVLAIIAVVIWQFLPMGEVTYAPKIENSIAVISFKNQTGDEAYDYLRTAIPDLLITNLENSGNLHVATWERMRDLLDQMGKGDVDVIDEDLGFEICHREGIAAIVLGSFIKAGGMFATNVKVLNTENKKLLKSTSSRGEGVDSILRTQIDDLSREISLGIGISEQAIEASDISIADVTTDSMVAYSHFLKGREALDKLYFEDARQSLEKAVVIDPEFAIAYLNLSNVYGSLGLREARNEAIEKAKTYSEKATEKERLFIEAAYAGIIERDHEKRLAMLQQIAEKYPKEKLVHASLGQYYTGEKSYDRAIAEYNKALELDPNNGLILNELAFVYVGMEDYAKAVEYFERYIAVSPGEANPLDSLAHCYFLLGRFDEAIAKSKEALTIKPDWSFSYTVISYIYALRENYAEAIKWIDQGIAVAPSPDERSNALLIKAFYYYWLGQLEKSLREIRSASVLAESAGDIQMNAYAERLAVIVYYEKGEFELARESLKRCHEALQKIYSAPLFRGLESEFLIEEDIKEGRIDSAKARLAEIKSLLPELPPNIRDGAKSGFDLLHAEVALVENTLEDVSSIEEAFATIKKLGARRISGGLGFASLAGINQPRERDILARAYRQIGELDKAIAEYEQLVTLDPESKYRFLTYPKFHYQLAKLYEEKDWKGKAIEHYEKFLELWKDADDHLLEKGDAQKRLAVLQEN
jgi:serine/threonine protein kinase/Tfp pilus assembly protein PilF